MSRVSWPTNGSPLPCRLHGIAPIFVLSHSTCSLTLQLRYCPVFSSSVALRLSSIVFRISLVRNLLDVSGVYLSDSFPSHLGFGFNFLLSSSISANFNHAPKTSLRARLVCMYYEALTNILLWKSSSLDLYRAFPSVSRRIRWGGTFLYRVFRRIRSGWSARPDIATNIRILRRW